MKAIKTIQWVINLLFYISILSVGIFVLSYPVWLFMGDKIPFTFKEIQFIYNSNWSTKVLFLVVIISQILFTIGFYHLKTVTRLFISNKTFSLASITHLKKAGNLFTFIGLLILLLRAFNWIFDTSIVSIWNGIDMLYLFILFIGLFFILISKVLIEARQLKQENDLTI
ncbi:hypothetical protein GCM10011416_08930 [Polaribacter pacificus]|uniref:DUF2975 domain-containing protein n=1 Tax=Polaribacter pacificus TaxID=1775173 RepID=A0A917HXD4_9FLAO|nr:DUF2975 domain-containing protein [Polaribacter pacificus]GGG93892.1 hypothetical protein GCM10011416_08930 [Polaribacter pacificus]